MSMPVALDGAEVHQQHTLQGHITVEVLEMHNIQYTVRSHNNYVPGWLPVGLYMELQS